MAAKKKITYQDLHDLYVDAMGGDWQAENELRDSVRKMSKAANQQMRMLESRNVRGEAYKRVQDYLGAKTKNDRKRFKENVQGLSIDELKDQMGAVAEFRNAKDYGIREAYDLQIDVLKPKLEKAGIDVDDDAITRFMNEFLKTDAFRELQRVYISTDLIREAQEAFRLGRTVNDLLAEYNSYKKGEKDSPDLIQVWQRFSRRK